MGQEVVGGACQQVSVGMVSAGGDADGAIAAGDATGNIMWCVTDDERCLRGEVSPGERFGAFSGQSRQRCSCCGFVTESAAAEVGGDCGGTQFSPGDWFQVAGHEAHTDLSGGEIGQGLSSEGGERIAEVRWFVACIGMGHCCEEIGQEWGNRFTIDSQAGKHRIGDGHVSATGGITNGLRGERDTEHFLAGVANCLAVRG